MTMARHHRRVFAGWLIMVAVGLAGLPHLLGSVLAPPIEVSGSESQRASRLMADNLPTLGDETMTVVFHSSVRETAHPMFRAAITAATKALRQEDGVSGVLLMPVAGDPDRKLALADTLEPLRPLFHDKHTAYLMVGATGDDRQRQERAPLLQIAVDRAAQAASNGEVRAYLVGVSAFGHLVQQIEIADLLRIELIAIPLAIAVLWWGLRAAVAALVPVLVAGASIVTTLGLFSLLTGVFTVDGMLLVGVNALGLGIGIDYALFIMGRYREELAAGAAPERAIAVAAATTGRTVLYSGLILLLACTSLFMVRWHVFAQAGIGTIAVIVVTTLAAVTLLPAVLVRVTPWLDSAAPGTNRRTGRLARWAEHLMRRPWPYAIGVTAGLLCAAIPVSDMSMGIDLERDAIGGTPYFAGLTLAENEVPGSSGAIAVLLSRPTDTAEVDSRQLQAALRADPDVVAVTAMDDGDDVTAILVWSKQSIDSPAVVDLVQRIRTDIVPASAPSGVSTLVGGPGALAADILIETSTKLWWVIGYVLILMFLVLVVVLRSLLLPVKAILMSLLATGAAYGLTVLVFGHGSGTAALWPQVPLIVFVLLFGLSTDYELFLVRRIQEEYQATGDNRGSVAIGLQRTAIPISLAAVILVVGYGSLLVSRINGLQEFGFAIAAALIIDATLIRLVLVPALMQIMGRWNWWLPWSPRLSAPAREPSSGANRFPSRCAAAPNAR
ncbi:MMPL family transporter [Nocardia iowensis]|uniref:MMPL family transporter n=2 Tax=Nocardia iowensis TaxID=204891 RepID=A0ABX8RUA0_NOCIO|nr:MMPL family transporter [Nocardia iowensis]